MPVARVVGVAVRRKRRGRPPKKKRQRKVQVWSHLPPRIVAWLSRRAGVRARKSLSELVGDILVREHQEELCVTATRTHLMGSGPDAISAGAKVVEPPGAPGRNAVILIRLEGEGCAAIRDRLGGEECCAQALKVVEGWTCGYLNGKKQGVDAARQDRGEAARNGARKPAMSKSKVAVAANAGHPVNGGDERSAFAPAIAPRPRPSWWPT